MRNLIFGLLACLVLAACDTGPRSADEHQQQSQAASTAQGDRSVGMPAIINWVEKRQVKDLYEMRDKNFPTWSYLQSYDGHLLCFGHGTGFGIPYAVQYSNPQSFVYQRPIYEGEAADASNISRQAIQKPQPEPNGLYMPGQADGTWVQTLDPSDNQVKPVYIEPHVVVSPFRLRGKIVSLDCDDDTPALTTKQEKK